MTGIVSVHSGDYIGQSLPENRAQRITVPRWIKNKVELLPNGKKRAPKEIAWFFRMLETGSAEQAVGEIWTKLAEQNIKWKAWELKQRHRDLLAQAVKFQRAFIEPRSLRMFDYAMEVAMHPDNRDNPQMLMVGVKAAGEILDRGGMPKGARIHGLDTDPDDGKDQLTEHDSFKLIDQLVSAEGIDAVRYMKIIRDHKRFREYVTERWPLKEIGEPVARVVA